MMAFILARLMIEAASLLTALVIVPVQWLTGGPSKAIAALIVLYAVGAMCGPSKEDREAFAAFQKQRGMH